MLIKKTFWLLLLILIIATFLRVNQLLSLPPGLYPDEAMNGNNAVEVIAQRQFKVFYPENNGREGLFINIQALFLKFLPQEPWSLRFPSALFGILTVLGMYFLTIELFNKTRWKSTTVALLASFFLATSFWHINFSRIGFRAIMAPFFLVWGLYFFLLAIKKISASDRNFLIFPVLSGLLIGLGIHSYIAYRIMPLIFIAFLPFFWKEKRFWMVLGITALFALIASGPLFLYYYQNPSDFLGRTSQVSVFSGDAPFRDIAKNALQTIGMLNISGDYNARHNVPGRPALFWPVGLFFWIGVFVGIMALTKRLKPRNINSKLPFVLLFTWIILAMLPVVVSNEGIPHALRAILMIPPIIIFSAIGGTKLWGWVRQKPLFQIGKNKTILHIGSALLLSLLLFEAHTTYFYLWGKNEITAKAFNAEYVEIGHAINGLPQEIPKYVVVEAGGVNVRSIPMPAQTVMFMTDSFVEESRAEKNLHYVLPNETNNMTENSVVFTIR